MTHNTYIISNDFYIKNDLSSFLIYFDFFITPNIPLTRFIKSALLRRIAYFSLRALVIVLFVLQFYKLRYKVTILDENAIIIFKGSGKWSNIIKLEKHNGSIIVKKTVYNKEIFNKEKEFYNRYKNNKSNIKLPKCTFKKDNLIEMQFLKMNSFRKLIVDGTFDLKTSLMHFTKIKEELTILYETDPALIHGDLWPTNIFVDNSTYYLIDFSECFISSFNYDCYVLLYSILTSFNFIQSNEKSIINFNRNEISTLHLMKISLNELKKTEKQFNSYRKKRFSGV